MDYVEMSNEQRRQLIDAQQVYQTWWPATMELAAIGTMHWQKTKGRRYLIEKHGIVRKSHGAETPALVKQKTEHDDYRTRLKQRVKASGGRVDKMARVNKALGLGRLRRIVAEIVRELDRRRLLGTHVIIVGTNALHAYEAGYGVLIGSEHVATTDADLLWDARKSLQLASASVDADGLLGILRGVDPSFTANYGYNAENDEGYMVDLLSPEMAETGPLLEGLATPDLLPTAMPGLVWLLEAPRYEEVVIADDGYPVRLVVPDPRVFAAHKLWVSRQDSRKAVRGRKDIAHARLMSGLVATHSNLSFAAKDMPWLAKPLRPLMRELAASAKTATKAAGEGR